MQGIRQPEALLGITGERILDSVGDNRVRRGEYSFISRRRSAVIVEISVYN